MSAQYKRIPLGVEALFLPDGTVKPKRLIYNGTVFDITRVVQIRPYCPRVVRAIAPIEYTVRIDGRERQIYYEEDTNTWFSVKEVHD